MVCFMDPLKNRLPDSSSQFEDWTCIQWPFQDPKLEVPTIYKAYFLGLCKGISPENMALYGPVPPI